MSPGFDFKSCCVFNMRYRAAKIWNAVSDDIKLMPLKQFKKKI